MQEQLHASSERVYRDLQQEGHEGVFEGLLEQYLDLDRSVLL